METHAENAKAGEVATMQEQSSAKPINTSKPNGTAKYQSTPFNPKATLLLDVLPSQSADTARMNRQTEPPESMLQRLLMNTEASARRTQSSRTKWQLATLVLGMLFIPAVVVIGWLYFETGATGTVKGRSTLENQSLKEQMNTATAQITGLKGEMESLLGRNIELASENSQLKNQATRVPATLPAVAAEAEQKPSPVPTSKAVATNVPSLDAGRIEAMRKGTFPNGASKDELIAALGEPDRIYKSNKYEQLVYFGRKPGRFWFIGNWLVQTAD